MNPPVIDTKKFKQLTSLLFIFLSGAAALFILSVLSSRLTIAPGNKQALTEGVSCSTANVTLKISPETADVSDSFTFKYIGTEGDLWTDNLWCPRATFESNPAACTQAVSDQVVKNPDGTSCKITIKRCAADDASCSGRTCVAQKNGQFVWIHRWRNCPEGVNDESQCSPDPKCELTSAFTVGNVASTPIPSAVPVTSPVVTATPVAGAIVCGALDVNGDGFLNIIDFDYFASKTYLKSCSDRPPGLTAQQKICGARDYNNDGQIKIEDLNNFARRYLKAGCQPT